MTPLQLLDSDGENQAVRWFLACYGGGGDKSIGTMKLHLEMSGFDGCWPDWCNTAPAGAHLTKGGAQLWLRHLFNLEVQQATTSDERAELIARLDEASSPGWTHEEIDELCGKAADMLDADAKEIEGWKADQKENLKNQCDLHAALQAERVPKVWKPDMAHLANEWADVATSGICWLRNIKDGISTVDEAIENTAEGIEHCRAVSKAVRESVQGEKP